ncbi:hypothetical protein [Roseicyclus persicicus]|uniref:Uncharacterized protein n=1 Tax=Roseicyclus persicicus TaxID=2650661 RepID=A0A7X6JX49_9RHOB|nr:hypothetical protein [Roseibacterium persicicum]NKX43019.1 hypothetical protein [Roseibacterium persicicum]
MRLASTLLIAGLAAAVAAPLAAQELRDCNRWEANAQNLMDPPEVAVRRFAEGAIRVIGLDTGEPACCSAHLMVMHPLPGEPFPGCTLVSDTGGMGFSGLRMEALTARYDPAAGLILTVPVGAYNGMASVFRDMTVTVNQATGEVTAR